MFVLFGSVTNYLTFCRHSQAIIKSGKKIENFCMHSNGNRIKCTYKATKRTFINATACHIRAQPAKWDYACNIMIRV